uniref:Bm9072, isoform e n=1 Tax=Brugia malayi TaxID=6279 RepID=A0A1I9G6M0_BRUMA|nr:Bm9072, isoform e [Brugia malayi]
MHVNRQHGHSLLRFERKYKASITETRNKTRKVSIQSDYPNRLLTTNSDQLSMISALDQNRNGLQTSKTKVSGDSLFILGRMDKEEECDKENDDTGNSDSDNDEYDTDYDDDEIGGNDDVDDEIGGNDDHGNNGDDGDDDDDDNDDGDDDGDDDDGDDDNGDDNDDGDDDDDDNDGDDDNDDSDGGSMNDSIDETFISEPKMAFKILFPHDTCGLLLLLLLLSLSLLSLLLLLIDAIQLMSFDLFFFVNAAEKERSKKVMLNSTGFCLVSPALIIDFLLGFSLDYQQILAYDWSCGLVNIPSFSRIINLPKERIIWNAAVLLHLPLRFLLVLTNYRICRIPSNELCNRKLHEVLSRIIILSGLVEILMVLLLTVIGEREETHQLHGTHFNWHVHFFMIFAFSSAIHFTVITTTYRRSKHYVEHFNGHWSFNLKFYLTLVYIALLPVTFLFFAMYWILCYNFAYDFFALSEYLLILVNYAFHASSFILSYLALYIFLLTNCIEIA